MRIVLVICAIHIWWGFSLILGVPLPRPFGALEPFYMLPHANDLLVGLTLSISGLLPLTMQYLPKKFWCHACMMIPQQCVLAWGFLLGVEDVIWSADGRSWYALYTGAWFFGHAYELSELLLAEVIKRRASTNGQ